MKKIITIIIALVILLSGVYFIGSGFVKNSSVYITDYTVSEDGKEITVETAVSSSVGYIRKANIKSADGKLYIDFYNAFGGLNGKLGAKNTFTFPLIGDVELIALYRNTDCYETVLINDNGQWQRTEK